jgi:hypothetical protein
VIERIIVKSDINLDGFELPAIENAKHIVGECEDGRPCVISAHQRSRHFLVGSMAVSE